MKFDKLINNCGPDSCMPTAIYNLGILLGRQLDIKEIKQNGSTAFECFRTVLKYFPNAMDIKYHHELEYDSICIEYYPHSLNGHAWLLFKRNGIYYSHNLIPDEGLKEHQTNYLFANKHMVGVLGIPP